MIEEASEPGDTGAGAFEGRSAPSLSRRRLLGGGGLAAGLAALAAACGSGGKGEDTGPTGSEATATAGARSNRDVDVISFAAGLEVLAVGTYQAALDAAATGRLAPVPPAGAELVKTARAQHQLYLDALNQVVTAAGRPPVARPNPPLTAVVQSRFASIRDFAGLARLARDLEQIAAATYLSVIPTLEGKDAIKLAGQAHINGMERAAVLAYLLGEYPVPDTFAGTDRAAKPG